MGGWELHIVSHDSQKDSLATRHSTICGVTHRETVASVGGRNLERHGKGEGHGSGISQDFEIFLLYNEQKARKTHVAHGTCHNVCLGILLVITKVSSSMLFELRW